MSNFEALEAIELVTDEELETLVGAGAGIVPTVTKDCPNFVSGVHISWGGITVDKNC